jgi:hypothetical protein
MATPEQMRDAVATYIHEIHRSYVDQAVLFPPGVRGRMPLLAAQAQALTVAAVGARNLHLLATTDPLGPPREPEVVLDGGYGDCRWQVRFFDPVVLPSLGLLDETEAPAYAQVRHALGVGTVVYHVVAHPGAGLSAHQATHVGAGLANAHSASARDFETIRARLAGREELVDEMQAAAAAGLLRAQALLARAILPYNEDVRVACDAEVPDPDAIRKALLTGAGGRTQWTPRAVAS